MTRNERRRETLEKKIAAVDAKMQPLHRLRAFYEGEIELLDQFEAAERAEAEATLGLNNPNEEAA
jgi:hypothetical protein